MNKSKMKIMNKTFCTFIILLFSCAGNAQPTNIFPSNGNVGIGTTSPNSALDVHGWVQFITPSEIRVARFDNTYLFAQAVSGSCARLGVWDSDLGARDLILQLPGGNVGIGVPNPTALLTLRDAGCETLRIGDNSNRTNTTAQIKGSLDAWAPSSNAVSEIGAVDTNYYNNGVNSTWSGALLRWYGFESTELWGNTPLNGAAIVIGQNSNQLLLGVNNYVPIQFANPAGILATIAPDGSVGIGTSAPTHKLTVSGAIRAKEVIVDTGWADDAFMPGYKLASLSEVKAHISQQGRLPGVPSAAEVAKSGISVGETQAILLRKIEELTLHAIEQQEQIQKLQVEIRALRAKAQ